VTKGVFAICVRCILQVVSGCTPGETEHKMQPCHNKYAAILTAINTFTPKSPIQEGRPNKILILVIRGAFVICVRYIFASGWWAYIQ
jgi:hypothetical protein